MADGDVQCQVAVNGPVGDEDVGRAQEGRRVNCLLPGAGHPVGLEEVDKPVLDGKMPAVLLPPVTRDGVVTEDVHRVPTQGAGPACKGLLQDRDPQEPPEEETEQARGARVPQGGRRGHGEPGRGPLPCWNERRMESRLETEASNALRRRVYRRVAQYFCVSCAGVTPSIDSWAIHEARGSASGPRRSHIAVMVPTAPDGGHAVSGVSKARASWPWSIHWRMAERRPGRDESAAVLMPRPPRVKGNVDCAQCPDHRLQTTSEAPVCSGEEGLQLCGVAGAQRVVQAARIHARAEEG